MEIRSNVDTTILNEYKAVSLDEDKPPVYQLKDEDIQKNRWSNIIPVETTRVKLGGRRNDYINANFVNASSNTYICTQGPLPETTADFWQMVYEQNSRVIVMLCNLVERNKVRCHKYWPKHNESKRYGDIVVKFVKQATAPGLQLRKFHLFYRQESGTPDRVVTQIHYTEWPDFGTPDSTLAIRNVCEMYNHYSRGGGGPGTIHCSAGIGRTGSFVAIHSCLSDLFRFGACNVQQTVRSLRRQRNGMIQTAEQYLFVYQSLKDTVIAVKKKNNNAMIQPTLESSGEQDNGVQPMELELNDDEVLVTEMLLSNRPISSYCLLNDTGMNMSPSVSRNNTMNCK